MNGRGSLKNAPTVVRAMKNAMKIKSRVFIARKITHIELAVNPNNTNG